MNDSGDFSDIRKETMGSGEGSSKEKEKQWSASLSGALSLTTSTLRLASLIGGGEGALWTCGGGGVKGGELGFLLEMGVWMRMGKIR